MTEKGSRFLQYMAASTGNLNIVACGAILGWTSPILPKLAEDNPIAPDNQLLRPITNDEKAWIGSLVPLGVMFGSFVSGYLGEWLGRKRSMLMSTFPFLIGWILVGTAHDIIQIYAGRFILGLALAMPFTVLPMYIGEVSEVAIRGTLGSFLQLFITFGFLFSYSVGPFVSYTVFWLLCASLHVAFFIGFMFMPESPHFLLSKGREAEAAEALARFRGKSLDGVRKEMEEMQAEIEEAYRIKASWNDVFKVKVNIKAIVLTSILMSFQEFMGIDVVLFYVEDIFREAGTSNTAISAIIIGFVQMISSVITPIVVDRSGRKILLVISSIGSGITVGILGAFFYLKNKTDFDTTTIGWVPLATLVVYIIAYSIGWGPLPWTVMGEMFAPAVKPKASSICVFAIWSFSFLLTKFFTNVTPDVGFFFFAACCAVNIVFIVFMFPETKGKTLAEIQQKLSRGRSKAEEIGEESSIRNSVAGAENKMVIYGDLGEGKERELTRY
ncbi:facilitated trehalose transporter Tret1-like [Nasonia vitripennis]|uniref:Major facilitator superfamily (MFS) profile domain-containing protein n=1 Tax=Nasonia vitripennis TaxID=7425 RepID=A0A7M7LJX2_NASVI|nr:facilitated trehalose transporter Tret1-like [Nasonia vitripennis]